MRDKKTNKYRDMKCLYNDIECDWSEPTGDIECTKCVHYNKAKKSTSILNWLSELLNKLFTKKRKEQI
jgi:hypothetical protein